MTCINTGSDDQLEPKLKFDASVSDSNTDDKTATSL